jgi:hypothetical protein
MPPPAWLRGFIVSGRAIDLMLAFMIAEFVLLCWLRRSDRRAPIDSLIALLPGACLLLAVRCALAGADWIWVAAWLTLSLPAHLADLARRRL